MARPIALTCLWLTALGIAACGGGDDTPQPTTSAEPQRSIDEFVSAGPHDVAVLKIRDLGSIRIQLLAELAPKTVDNFSKLARSGFYHGTLFHRVIPDFMIQGGDPNTKGPDPRTYGKGGPGYTIEDEFSQAPHQRGVISMANKGHRNSGGSQFFIVHQDALRLDGKYAAFGRVIEGMEVVDAITQLEIDSYGRYGPANRPYPKSAVIESIQIEAAALSQTGS